MQATGAFSGALRRLLRFLMYIAHMSAASRHSGERRFPAQFFVLAVGFISACLAVSALFTFTMLLRLRTQYLSNRGREIATAIEGQVRGPGRRNNPQFWQSLLEDNYGLYADTVGYLEVVDQSGQELAHAGREASDTGSSVYVSELTLARGAGPHSGMTPLIAGWRLRVAVYSSSAAFIARQGYLQLAVSAIAIAFLVAVSLYLLRTTRRFLELQDQERAEQHLKSLGTMAAALAHEIRNPLGAMKGLTQLAQEQLPPDHGAQTAMNTVVREAERLERLVSELLDFAGPRKPEVQEFDLADLLADTHAILDPKLREMGVALDISAPPGLKLRSDPNGVRQVLLNVLNNALDVTAKGGRVTLYARKEDRNVAVIEVDDLGEGIGDRDPESLFQPFVTTKTRGTGLGLAVCRQIVTSVGGSISLANRAPRGARCTVRLPDRELAGVQSRGGESLG